MPPLKWRILRDDPLSAARNMALDHALAMTSRKGEGALRLYTWESPTVSFGRHEPAQGIFDAAVAAKNGVGFVRRPTGGRSVLHQIEATYAVVLPDRLFGGPKGIYKKVNEGLAAALVALGAPATVSLGGAVLAPDAGPCFQVPAPGEVLAGGRKLVGSAQVRIGSAILQHGSIILDGDQSLLGEIIPGAEITPPATLFSLIDPVDGDTLAEAIVDGLKGALDGTWEQDEYRSGEEAEAEWLERERYSDEQWTWSK